MEKVFKNLENQFDTEEPTVGHFNRFQKKIEEQKKSKKGNQFYRFIAVAASLLLILTLGFGRMQSAKGVELADVSPKMEETQDYFASVIHKELEKIEKIKNKENEKIINDALQHLEFLEEDYKKQTIALKDNTDNKNIIFAMINNFQQRITVLKNLLNELNNFEQLKNIKNENSNI